jgi:hypothetical protein
VTSGRPLPIGTPRQTDLPALFVETFEDLHLLEAMNIFEGFSIHLFHVNDELLARRIEVRGPLLYDVQDAQRNKKGAGGIPTRNINMADHILVGNDTQDTIPVPSWTDFKKRYTATDLPCIVRNFGSLTFPNKTERKAKRIVLRASWADESLKADMLLPTDTYEVR